MEKVITEAFLRKLFLHGVPETFGLHEGQILTPSAAQFLGEKRVEILTGRVATGISPLADFPSAEGFVSVADDKQYDVKPEHLTHLTGKQLIPKDHSRIIFRGKLDRLQAEVLLLQKQAVSYRDPALNKELEEVLLRVRSIMRADVLGEKLNGCEFFGLNEDEIRERSQHPQKYFGLEHLGLSTEMDYKILALNRLRTMVRSTEIAAVTAFSGDSGPGRIDIVQALNRMSSVIYVLMLKAAQETQPQGEVMNPRGLDDIVIKIKAECGGVEAVIPVELSARHVHLSAEDAEKLFGGQLTSVRELSQPGQFLSKERVCLVGPNGQLDNVAVLGPARGKTQVEISLSDARILGVTPPLRQSGDTAGSSGIKIVTERATVSLTEGLLIPGRHLHMQPQDALKLGVQDREFVRVRVGDARALVFEKVLVRVNEDYRLAMHIDFDEGNACGWGPGTIGSLILAQMDNPTGPAKRLAPEVENFTSLKKRLVTERDILEAHKKGISVLRVCIDALLTPLALDCAKECGIRLQKTEKVK